MRSRLVLAILTAGALSQPGCLNGSRIAPVRSADHDTMDLVRTRAMVLARYEVTFDAATRGRHSDDVVIDARFTAPSGRITSVGGFASHGHYKVRFTPREPGLHTWSIRVDGEERATRRGEVDVVPSKRRGFVHVDPEHRHRLVLDDGSTVFVLGENRFNVYDPSWNHAHADIRTYLERMAAYGMTAIRVVLFASCASGGAHGRIGCLEDAVGRFDERTADALDTLFDAAEATSIEVVLVIYGLGFTSGAKPWRSWDDNPYSTAQGGPAQSPKQFFTSPAVRQTAMRKLRYVADRWASSPRLMAVDLLDEPERDGPIAERTWIPWAEEMSRAFRSFDPYGHLVTVGSAGLHWNIDGDELPWYASSANDLVEWQLHENEVHEPHALANAMTHKVQETWSSEKPVLCGSFAYAGEDSSTYDHTHVGLWSLAMSGAGALAHSAPLALPATNRSAETRSPFGADSDEPMTAERAKHFEVLSTFLQSLDPRRAYSPRSDVRVISPGGARVWSLATEDKTERAVWILAPRPTYRDRVVGASIAITAPRGGSYRVRWVDDTTGESLSREHDRVVANDNDMLVIAVPPFLRHVAARISHEP